MLRAAASDAKTMYEWAVDPKLGGMEPQNVRLLTDANGELVTVAAVAAAVKDVVDVGVDQLILYFAGHGVMIGLNETWLLSEAPENGNEAIDVTACEGYAATGSTRHVVIISDACRVPARNYETSVLRAGSVFPNKRIGNQRVDVFFSCAPAQAALETNTTDARGIFSEILHDALCAVLRDVGGAETKVLEPGDPDDGARYILPEPLGAYLELAVNAQLIDMNLDIDQSPLIKTTGTTRNRRWIARFDQGRGREFSVRGPACDKPAPGSEVVPTVRTITQTANELIDAAFEGRSLRPLLRSARREGAAAFADSVEAMIEVSGRSTRALGQVEVIGAEITRSSGLDVANIIHGPRDSARTAVLELSNGISMALPVLARWRTVVTILDDGTPDVVFRPLFTLDQEEQTRENTVRAIASSAARRGRFSVARNALIASPRNSPIDPTLAIYAAHDHETVDAEASIERLGERVSFSVGDAGLFDLVARVGVPKGPVVPTVPLLIHGWDLPYTREIMTRSYVYSLRRMVRPTLWTAFDADAFSLLTEITT